MKNTHWFVILFLLCGFAATAQPDSTLFLCKDVVKVKGCNQYVGTITHIDAAGNLKIATWNGMVLSIPSTSVVNIRQECMPRYKGQQRLRPVFKEKGWYQFTRIAVVASQSANGLLLQHSAGYRFSHWLHAGLGTGVENFTPVDEPGTYPVFAECRTFLSRNTISPFIGVNGGWAWMGKSNTSIWGETSTWKGGLMGNIQVGYRFGNHVMVYTGLRIQHQKRNWENPWGNLRGVDKLVKRRLELGIGVYI